MKSQVCKWAVASLCLPPVLYIFRTQRLLKAYRATVDTEERAVDDTDGKQRVGHALEEAAQLRKVKRRTQLIIVDAERSVAA